MSSIVVSEFSPTTLPVSAGKFSLFCAQAAKNTEIIVKKSSFFIGKYKVNKLIFRLQKYKKNQNVKNEHRIEIRNFLENYFPKKSEFEK